MGVSTIEYPISLLLEPSDTAWLGESGAEKNLHGEWFNMPGSKKTITDDGNWSCYSEALILNAVWIAHPDVILFQFI